MFGGDLKLTIICFCSCINVLKVWNGFSIDWMEARGMAKWLNVKMIVTFHV